MATIQVADEAGTCFGVERALQMVRQAAQEATGPIATLGPLIHNPTVVRELADHGVGVADSPAQPAGSTLVIRAHGVGPAELAQAREHGVSIVDATCPYVHKVHALAERLHREGYQVLVLGERGHAEVEGTLGHAPGARVVAGPDDVRALASRGELAGKVGLVVQTTQTRERLRQTVDALLEHAEELRVFDTICEATARRQHAAAELAARSDVMVVIGGRNSANTTHLAEICQARCARTHHIEGADELEAAWFRGAGLIGVTAGASTPKDQIDTVLSGIRQLAPQD